MREQAGQECPAYLWRLGEKGVRADLECADFRRFGWGSRSGSRGRRGQEAIVDCWLEG